MAKKVQMYAEKAAEHYDPPQQSSVGVMTPHNTLKSWQVFKLYSECVALICTL